MPESVTDRLTTTTEQIFFLTKKPDYWFDLDAIREPHAASSLRQVSENGGDQMIGGNTGQDYPGTPQRIEAEQLIHPAGKNPGDVFEVAVKPFPEAHFAVFPPKLVVKPVKSTCPPKVCTECRTPYERDIDHEPLDTETIKEAYPERADKVGSDERFDDVRRCVSGEEMRELAPKPEDNGWQQVCGCETDETEAGVVLDPFAGAGTTLLKARDLGRQFVGIELNADYCDIARKRLGMQVENPETLRENSQSGFERFTTGGESV